MISATSLGNLAPSTDHNWPSSCSSTPQGTVETKFTSGEHIAAVWLQEDSSSTYEWYLGMYEILLYHRRECWSHHKENVYKKMEDYLILFPKQ